jgi:single-strand DNA-binding protein
MPYLNHYTCVGNLTKAPELRFQSTGGNQALCILNVAINRGTRDECGEKKTQTTFINDIEVWGPTAEACAHFLTSGSMILVEGRLEVDQWQDKNTGAKRSRMKVVAESVQFLRIRHPDGGENPERGPASDEPSPGPTSRRTPRGKSGSGIDVA